MCSVCVSVCVCVRAVCACSVCEEDPLILDPHDAVCMHTHTQPSHRCIYKAIIQDIEMDVCVSACMVCAFVVRV